MWLRTRARLIGFIFNLTWPWSDFYVSLLCVCVFFFFPVCAAVTCVCTRFEGVHVGLCVTLCQAVTVGKAPVCEEGQSPG